MPSSSKAVFATQAHKGLPDDVPNSLNLQYGQESSTSTFGRLLVTVFLRDPESVDPVR
jgi:hypothetical protein